MSLENYKHYFWGEQSFHFSLEEDNIWSYQKYLELEFSLIGLSKYLNNKKYINKELSKNIYFLGLRINLLIEFHRNPNNICDLDGYNEEEVEYCLDRFNHIMRILWQTGSYNYEEALPFFEENPLFKSHED